MGQLGEEEGNAMKTTTELWLDIRDTAVPHGKLAFWWLYQAGIALKTPGGTIVLVDPYLSDAVMRSYQQPRNVPSPLNPLEVEADALLATHSHEDHLDPDSIAGFLSHERTQFVGPPMAVEKVVSSGVGELRTRSVSRGDVFEIGDLTVRAVHARHLVGSEPTPDAVGFLLEADGVSVYHSGDTEYDSEIVSDTRGVSASLVPINGTTGNMNAHEAALLSWLQGARLAMPFHYGLWRDADYGEGATLDPQLFVDTYHRLNPEGQTLVLSPGTAVVIDCDGLARGQVLARDAKESGRH
jgi:L-ascorbate 6-phosphate lactonase